MSCSVNLAPDALVRSKLDEFFWEWLSLPESQKIVRQVVRLGKDDVGSVVEAPAPPGPSFHGGLRGSPSGRPSPPGSPHARGFSREGPAGDPAAAGGAGGQRSPEVLPSAAKDAAAAATTARAASAEPERGPRDQQGAAPAAAGAVVEPGTRGVSSWMVSTGSSEIPRFWLPKQTCPVDTLPADAQRQIRDHFERLNMSEGIRAHNQLESIVTDVFKLSKYFVVPIFHKIKVFYSLAEEPAKSNIGNLDLLTQSKVPITQQMLIDWCHGRIQPDDPVLSFFYVVKKEVNSWIERDDFSIFLLTILLTHPGLDFLRETQEFQDRYADTVISRIFFVYDRKDVGRIYLSSLRRYKPSVIEIWKQLADYDDIKMVRDYFSYEHFYVIYCTFWELDVDHDFLLDKDDLLKFDGHALSRRTVDRIFSEIPAKFTSAVPGKMGYEDFIRFLLCDQDRQTDRSMEYWFSMFDLDGDGCIRDLEMKYFYEEQVQRMECLNYDTIPFADVMCQMNDMISPKFEGQFCLNDFKRRRKFAGTFFSLFSSLNKFLAFEHRDPFLSKQEQLDNPSFSDWDRWCADEYLRLAMEEGDDQDEDGARGDG